MTTGDIWTHGIDVVEANNREFVVRWTTRQLYIAHRLLQLVSGFGTQMSLRSCSKYCTPDLTYRQVGIYDSALSQLLDGDFALARCAPASAVQACCDRSPSSTQLSTVYWMTLMMSPVVSVVKQRKDASAERRRCHVTGIFLNLRDFLGQKLVESFDADSRAGGYATETEQCVHAP